MLGTHSKWTKLNKGSSLSLVSLQVDEIVLPCRDGSGAHSLLVHMEITSSDPGGEEPPRIPDTAGQVPSVQQVIRMLSQTGKRGTAVVVPKGEKTKRLMPP